VRGLCMHVCMHMSVSFMYVCIMHVVYKRMQMLTCSCAYVCMYTYMYARIYVNGLMCFSSLARFTYHSCKSVRDKVYLHHD
jgi:hypothetical protein